MSIQKKAKTNKVSKKLQTTASLKKLLKGIKDATLDTQDTQIQPVVTTPNVMMTITKASNWIQCNQWKIAQNKNNYFFSH